MPISKDKYEGGDEPFTMVKMLVASFEKLERTVEMEAYINKIYDEYFDNRTYLIEQYLDSIGDLIEALGI